MIRLAISAVFAALSLNSALAQTLPRDAVLEDIAVARAALERVHPGYDRYTSADTLNTLWTDLEDQTTRGITQYEFYLGLSLITAQIRCDHTKVELTSMMEQQRSIDPVYLPFTFRLFEDDQGHARMFVDISGDDRLQRGDEILRIDGDKVAERVASAAEYVPVDGFTDHVKTRLMALPGEILGTDFEHYDALLSDMSARVLLQVMTVDGERVTVEADRLTWPESLALRGEPRRRNFSDDDAVTVDYPMDGVAVLNVETFVNYRTPVNPDDVYRRSFAEIADADTETLIVDLRRNGGGSNDAQIGLIRWIMNEPIAPVRDVRVKTIDLSGIRDYLGTWEEAALNPSPDFFNELENGWYSIRPEFGGAPGEIPPHPNAFTGEVIVLTSAVNSSGAASFMGAMLESGRATLVGERTGGSQEGPTAGIIFFLTLPNSELTVRVPYQLTLQAVSNPEFGQGFNPDIQVEETPESWFLDEDPVLERALELAGR